MGELMHPEVQRIMRYAERRGIPIVPFGPSAPPITDDAPYGTPGGIHWPSRTIVFNSAEAETAWGAVLLNHEVSHVLVDVEPDDVDEINSSMLALDFFAARRLRLTEWSTWMSEFRVGDAGHVEVTWSECSTRQRGQLLRASLAEAVRDGLLDERGRPTFIRARQAQ